MDKAIQDTLLARVYDVATETPLQLAQKLSAGAGCDVYLKREDLQPVHSFKIRGAYNKIASLNAEERDKGVIAASAGNHAQGVALSAQKLGIKATIVMPKTTPSIKVDAVRSYGADVILYGDNYSDAYDHCMTLHAKQGSTFIHPFDDPLVIAGQGTIAREIIEQLPDVTHIFVSTGGGGMLAGIAQFLKAVKPDTKIISVEPDDSNAMQASVKAGKRVTLPHVGIFADGVAVKQVGKETFRICRRIVDDFVTVNADQICAAIKLAYEDSRSLLEPAGAVAIAGLAAYRLPAGAKAVAICSGANLSFERLQFIAERTMLGSRQESLYAIRLKEQPGSLKIFCKKIVNGHNITEFNYRFANSEEAYIFVGIRIDGHHDKTAFDNKLSKQDYTFIDLSADELAKEHIRHMIGGKANSLQHEILYDINFPERPGALQDFLEGVGNAYNITLFHYRGLGGDTGRVLIGFDCSKPAALERIFQEVGFEFQRTDSAAARLFL